MVIAAECSLESKFALISSHVLRRAVVHELSRVALFYDFMFITGAQPKAGTGLKMQSRLQNSPYFCVFKYARAVKQEV